MVIELAFMVYLLAFNLAKSLKTVYFTFPAIIMDERGTVSVFKPHLNLQMLL